MQKIRISVHVTQFRRQISTKAAISNANRLRERGDHGLAFVLFISFLSLDLQYLFFENVIFQSKLIPRECMQVHLTFLNSMFVFACIRASRTINLILAASGLVPFLRLSWNPETSGNKRHILHYLSGLM